MPAVGQTLAVEGLAGLQRAFRVADATLVKELRDTLREVAEPVRSDAETLARSAIPRIGLPWSQFRVGVTSTSVYVAPRQRGVRRGQRGRPNLADLLLGRSMLPALDRNQSRIEGEMELMLGTVGRAWELA